MHFRGDIPAQRAVCNQPELTRAESGEGSVEFLSPRSGQSPLLLMGPGEEQQEADCMSPDPRTHHPVSHPDKSDKGYNFSSCSPQGEGRGQLLTSYAVTRCLVTLGVQTRGAETAVMLVT